MKRALFIYLAVLALLLVYPSADLLARGPSVSDTPTITIHPPRGDIPGPPGFYDVDDDDPDTGDADDLAGSRGGNPGQERNPTAPGFGQARSLLKVWWLFFFHRLF